MCAYRWGSARGRAKLGCPRGGDDASERRRHQRGCGDGLRRGGPAPGLEGDERVPARQAARAACRRRVPEAELVKAVKENRLALLPVDRVLGGTYTAARDRGADRAARRARWCASAACRGCPSPGPTTACSPTRTSRRPGRRSCSSTPASTTSASSRSPACSARAWPGWRRRSRPRSWRRSWRPATARTRWRCASRQLAEQLTPAIAPILVAAFKAHLRDSVQRGRARAWPSSRPATSPAPRTWRCASPTSSASPGSAGRSRCGELGTVAGRLAGLATSVTEPPVRLIKTIGDAAMFVSPEPAPLVGVALALVDAVEAGGAPQPAGRDRLRAGVASAPATTTATRSTWPAA